jgi:hypothetical protein
VLANVCSALFGAYPLQAVVLMLLTGCAATVNDFATGGLSRAGAVPRAPPMPIGAGAAHQGQPKLAVSCVLSGDRQPSTAFTCFTLKSLYAPSPAAELNAACPIGPFIRSAPAFICVALQQAYSVVDFSPGRAHPAALPDFPPQMQPPPQPACIESLSMQFTEMHAGDDFERIRDGLWLQLQPGYVCELHLALIRLQRGDAQTATGPQLQRILQDFCGRYDAHPSHSQTWGGRAPLSFSWSPTSGWNFSSGTNSAFT